MTSGFLVSTRAVPLYRRLIIDLRNRAYSETLNYTRIPCQHASLYCYLRMNYRLRCELDELVLQAFCDRSTNFSRAESLYANIDVP